MRPLVSFFFFSGGACAAGGERQRGGPQRERPHAADGGGLRRTLQRRAHPPRVRGRHQHSQQRVQGVRSHPRLLQGNTSHVFSSMESTVSDLDPDWCLFR